MPLGFAHLFGFVVPFELSEVVSNFMYQICTSAKNIYPHVVRSPVSNVLRELSNSELQCAVLN